METTILPKKPPTGSFPKPPKSDAPAAAPDQADWSLYELHVTDRAVHLIDPAVSGAYPTTSAVELKFTTASSIAPVLLAGNQAARDAARQALAEVREAFKQDPSWIKWARLRNQLAETERAAEEASQQAETHLAAARTALESGRDPVKDEKAYRTARETRVILTNRAKSLQKLTADAEQEARPLLQVALEAKRAEVLAAHRSRWDAVAGELVDEFRKRLGQLDAARAVVEILDVAGYAVRSHRQPHPLKALLALPE